MTYTQAAAFAVRIWPLPPAETGRTWGILRVSQSPEVFTVTALHVGGTLNGDVVRRAPVHSFTGTGRVTCHPECRRRARELPQARVLPFDNDPNPNKATGGYVRAAVLTPARRSAIARHAANTRWKGKK